MEWFHFSPFKVTSRWRQYICRYYWLIFLRFTCRMDVCVPKLSYLPAESATSCKIMRSCCWRLRSRTVYGFRALQLTNRSRHQKKKEKKTFFTTRVSRVFTPLSNHRKHSLTSTGRSIIKCFISNVYLFLNLFDSNIRIYRVFHCLSKKGRRPRKERAKIERKQKRNNREKIKKINERS